MSGRDARRAKRDKRGGYYGVCVDPDTLGRWTIREVPTAGKPYFVVQWSNPSDPNDIRVWRPSHER